jgi:hypothetical protein
MDIYITLGNNAIPLPTMFNGASFSLKIGILENKVLAGLQQSSMDGFPSSTVIGDPRKRRLPQ